MLRLWRFVFNPVRRASTICVQKHLADKCVKSDYDYLPFTKVSRISWEPILTPTIFVLEGINWTQNDGSDHISVSECPNLF